jgi:hypothetical protein
MFRLTDSFKHCGCLGLGTSGLGAELGSDRQMARPTRPTRRTLKPNNLSLFDRDLAIDFLTCLGKGCRQPRAASRNGKGIRKALFTSPPTKKLALRSPHAPSQEFQSSSSSLYPRPLPVNAASFDPLKLASPLITTAFPHPQGA